MKKRQNKNKLIEKVKYILGYIIYRMGTFEQFWWHGNESVTCTGLEIGTSLALYIVNLCHWAGYDIEFQSLIIFVAAFAYIMAIIIDIVMHNKWKKLKAKYLHDNVGNEDWTLKGWLIVFVLVLPLILLFTWLERPE